MTAVRSIVLCVRPLSHASEWREDPSLARERGLACKTRSSIVPFKLSILLLYKSIHIKNCKQTEFQK